MKKIFISYSHKDEKWKERVVTHLGVLQELEVWDDRKIEAGEDWFPEIEKAINESHAAILLITANVLTSNFIGTRNFSKSFAGFSFNYKTLCLG